MSDKEALGLNITKKGAFKRDVSHFRNWVSKESPDFPPAKDRYHLYVALACPWAHRALIMRKLKGENWNNH